MIRRINQYLQESVSIAPLAVFRVAFGFLMLYSVIRFAYWGWIDKFYITPKYFFPFLGFEWIKPLGATGMYLLFFLMGMAAFMMMIGLFYRVAAVFFFLSFTYVEMIDKTNYLNHYYFLSIVSFLMLLLPAHRYFSVDARIFPRIKTKTVPRWTISAIQLQLGLVYFFAGLAKVNYDWLIEAQPLRIWLPAKSYMPVIGSLMDEVWVAYFFSWFGCIYDLLIPFFLIRKSTRKYAYMAVVLFHVLTRILFPIGMFPWIMIVAALIFFDADFHQKIIDKTASLFKWRKLNVLPEKVISVAGKKIIFGILVLHFVVQIILPFRYLFYDGKLFWTEEGFRFSWRVMLMEKAGTAVFYVSDPAFPGEIEINNRDYLSYQQELMMSTQPDMILQFAHIIHDDYLGKQLKIGEKYFLFTSPEVRVKSFVTLNGSGNKPFIDPQVNLAAQQYNLKHRDWVLPFE